MTSSMAQSLRFAERSEERQLAFIREEGAGAHHKLRGVRTIAILAFTFVPLVWEMRLLFPALTTLLDPEKVWVHVTKDLNSQLRESIVLQLPASYVGFAKDRWYSSSLYRRSLVVGGPFGVGAPSATRRYMALKASADPANDAGRQHKSVPGLPLPPSPLGVFPLAVGSGVRESCVKYLTAAASAAGPVQHDSFHSAQPESGGNSIGAAAHQRLKADGLPTGLAELSGSRPATAAESAGTKGREPTTRTTPTRIPDAATASSSARTDDEVTGSRIITAALLGMPGLTISGPANGSETSPQKGGGSEQDGASREPRADPREERRTTTEQPADVRKLLSFWLDKDAYDASPSRPLVLSSTCVLLMRWLLLAVRAFAEAAAMSYEDHVSHAGLAVSLSPFKLALMTYCFSTWIVAFCLLPWVLPAAGSCMGGNLPGMTAPVTVAYEYYQWSLWVALACSVTLYGFGRLFGHRAATVAAAVGDALPSAPGDASVPLFSPATRRRQLFRSDAEVVHAPTGSGRANLLEQTAQEDERAQQHHEACSPRHDEGNSRSQLAQSGRSPASSFSCGRSSRTIQMSAVGAPGVNNNSRDSNISVGAAGAYSTNSIYSGVRDVEEYVTEAFSNESGAPERPGPVPTATGAATGETVTLVGVGRAIAAAPTTATTPVTATRGGDPPPAMTARTPSASPAVVQGLPRGDARETWAMGLLRAVRVRWTDSWAHLLHGRALAGDARETWAMGLLRAVRFRWTDSWAHLLHGRALARRRVNIMMNNAMLAKEICGAGALLTLAHTFSGSLLVLLGTDQQRAKILWMNGICLLLEMTARSLISKAEMRLRESGGDHRRHVGTSVFRLESGGGARGAPSIFSYQLEEGLLLSTAQDRYTLKQLSSTYFSVAKRCAAGDVAEPPDAASVACCCKCVRCRAAGHDREGTSNGHADAPDHTAVAETRGMSECAQEPAPAGLTAVTSQASDLADRRLGIYSGRSRNDSAEVTPCENSGTGAHSLVTSTASMDCISSSPAATSSSSSGSRSGRRLQIVGRDTSRERGGTRIIHSTAGCQRRTPSNREPVRSANKETTGNATVAGSQAAKTGDSRRSGPDTMKQVEARVELPLKKGLAGERSRSCPLETAQEGEVARISLDAVALADNEVAEADTSRRGLRKDVKRMQTSCRRRRCPVRNGSVDVHCANNTCRSGPQQQQQQRGAEGRIRARVDSAIGHSGSEADSSRQRTNRQPFPSARETSSRTLSLLSMRRQQHNFRRRGTIVMPGRSAAYIDHSAKYEDRYVISWSREDEEEQRADSARAGQRGKSLQDQRRRRQPHERQHEGWNGQHAQRRRHQLAEPPGESKKRHIGEQDLPTPILQQADPQQQEEEEGYHRQTRSRRQHHSVSGIARYERAAVDKRSLHLPGSDTSEEQRPYASCSSGGTARASWRNPESVVSGVYSTDERTPLADARPQRAAWERGVPVTRRAQPGPAACVGEPSPRGGPLVHWHGGATAAREPHYRSASDMQDAIRAAPFFPAATVATHPASGASAQDEAGGENAEGARAARTPPDASRASTSYTEAYAGVQGDRYTASSIERLSAHSATSSASSSLASPRGQERACNEAAETGELQGILPLCGLCTESRADIILLPCGHGGLCQGCATLMVGKHQERLNREGWRWSWASRRPNLTATADRRGERAIEWQERGALSTTYVQREQRLPRCPLCRRPVERLLKIDYICSCGADEKRNSERSLTTTAERTVAAHTLALLTKE